MTKIKLKLRKCGNEDLIVAEAHQPGDNGNTAEPKGASIDWKATSNDEFRVVFQDFLTDDWIFPFTGSDDGPWGPNNAPSLLVTNNATTRTLVQSAPPTIKYGVHCTSVSGVDPLDPMIIIRPTLQYAKDVNWVPLAVVSAVIGAAAGALLVLAMLSR